MKHKPNPSPPPQNLDSPPLAGAGRGKGSARKSGHAVQEEGAVSPSPLAGEDWGEGAASEPRVVSEGPITPYIAKPQQPRRSLESENLEPAVEQWPFDRAAIAQSDKGRRMKQRDYQERGVIPVIDQGQEFVGGYTDDQQMAYDGELPVVLFGDHTRSVKFVDQPFAVGADGIKIFRPAEGLLPKYFYYWMKSARLPDRGYGRHYQFLRKLSVPVPHPDEQRRIVAELETQLTRLDASVTALKRVQANLKRYRASVLKAACEGRLVSTEAELARREGRTYESGAEFFARIMAERRSKWAKPSKHPGPSFHNTANLPTLPDGWTWVQFGFLGADPFNTVQTGPFGAQLHNTEFTDSGVPVIAVGNLTGTGFRTNGVYFISQLKADQLARYDVWSGDLLFARSGATLGKVCVAPPVVQDWRMTGHILRARLNRAFIDPKIAVYALAALPAVRDQVFGNVRGVTRPGFNTSLLESILVPVPPPSEQRRIVAEVERRLSVIEELETIAEATLQRSGRLRNGLLKQAFAGSKDPTDVVPA